MAEPLATPEGAVSETRTAPCGAKLTEKAPADTLGFSTLCDQVRSPWTANTSMRLVRRSTTTRNLPSGLNANPAAPEVLVERKLVELGICLSVPLFNMKPTTLLLPPVLTT